MPPRHPLLLRPQDFLRGQKSLDQLLLTESFYSPEHLNLNPFAALMVETRLDDVSRARYPKHQMVRLAMVPRSVPLSPATPSHAREWHLSPMAMEIGQDKGPIPSSYILNNRKWIDIQVHSSKANRYMPAKFRFKNGRSFISHARVPSDLSNQVQNMYCTETKEAMRQARADRKNFGAFQAKGTRRSGESIDQGLPQTVRLVEGPPGLRFDKDTVLSIPNTIIELEDKPTFCTSANKDLAVSLIKLVLFLQ